MLHIYVYMYVYAKILSNKNYFYLYIHAPAFRLILCFLPSFSPEYLNISPIHGIIFISNSILILLLYMNGCTYTFLRTCLWKFCHYNYVDKIHTYKYTCMNACIYVCLPYVRKCIRIRKTYLYRYIYMSILHI